MFLLFVGPAYAQDESADAEVAQVVAGAEQDPDGALAEVARRLRGLGPEQVVARLAWERARARILGLAGRRPEAERAWQALQARGQDVGQQLLALAGVRLEVTRLNELRPGAPLALRVAGANTGPLSLRLYRVDAVGWRRALAADPARGLFEHLRAPVPRLLHKAASWTLAGLPPGGGQEETRSPEPLEQGLYLLSVSARGAALRLPLVVSRGLGILRRGVGAGLLALVARDSGEPIPGIELRGYDASGRGGEPLGTTDVQGLLRYRGDARWAAGWLPAAEGPQLLVLPLLPAAPGAEPGAPTVWRDLPAHRPGETVHLRVPRPAEEDLLRLHEPNGVVVASRRVGPGRGAVVPLSFPLLAGARPGIWRLSLGAWEQELRVLPPLAPGVRLELDAPVSCLAGESFEVRLRGRLGGWPFSGRALRCTLRAFSAETPRAEAGPRPLPRYASRIGSGPGRLLAEETVELDETGQARWQLVAPAAQEPLLLRVRARIADGPLRAEACRDLDLGTRAVRLSLELERRLAQPRELVRVRAVASTPAGRGLARQDLQLRVLAEDGGEPLETHALRTDAEGLAATSLALDRTGPLRIELRAAGEDGPPAASRTLWLGEPAQSAQAMALRLDANAPVPAGTARRLLATFPFAGGPLLLTREAEDLLEARLLRPGGAAWLGEEAPPAPPGCRLVLSAVRAGRVHRAEAAWARDAQRLRLEAQASPAVAAPGAGVVLNLLVRGPEGRPRAAQLFASIYPEASARLLDRRRSAPPLPRVLVRGRIGGGGSPGLAPAPPAPLETRPRARPEPLPLESLGTVVGDWSNGAGRGTIRLAAPRRAGRAWIRVEAVDSQGRIGSTWCPLDVQETVSLTLYGPTHLVEGDASHAVAELRCAGTLDLLPDATLRVAWEAENLALGIPRVEGARTVLQGDPGSGSLRVGAAPRLRLVFPLTTQRPLPGRLRVVASVEDDPAPPAQEELRIPVLPAGLSETRVQSGVIEPGESALIKLDAPRDVIGELTRLRLAADPQPICAALTALRELEAAPGLVAALEAALGRRLLGRVLTARQLRPQLGPAPPLEPLWQRLAAARDAAGGWGPWTELVLGGLLRLRADGCPVPTGFLQLAEERPTERSPLVLALSRQGRALRARLPGGSPEEAVELALALDLLDAPADETSAARQQALAAAAALSSPLGRARLLTLLCRKGDAAEAERREALLDALLLARRGPDWGPPSWTGAALRALVAAAQLREERPGTEVAVRLEGRELARAWSGGALEDWPGAITADGPLVAARSYLRIRARGPDRVHYSLLVEAWPRQRSQTPAGSSGLGLLQDAAGGEAPAEVPAGTRLRLLGLAKPDSPSDPWRLELALPSSAALLATPAGLELRGGRLVGEVMDPSVALELLAGPPGAARLPPLRLRAAGAAGAEARGASRQLSVIPPSN